MIEPGDHSGHDNALAIDSARQYLGSPRLARKPEPMSRDLIKTLTYLSIHLTIGFSVAYAFTGSASLAGGIALIEPCINAVAFFFHERAWKRVDGNAANDPGTLAHA